MGESPDTRVPWLLWPFYAIWKLLTFVLAITGRLLCALLGLGLMVVGVTTSLSIVGAVVGLPLAVFGFLLTIRALF